MRAILAACACDIREFGQERPIDGGKTRERFFELAAALTPIRHRDQAMSAAGF
jgi:hypothetical protein